MGIREKTYGKKKWNVHGNGYSGSMAIDFVDL
jgi:hypothetical protein